jgi:thioredoxin-like negative regulator of GroEL
VTAAELRALVEAVRDAEDVDAALRLADALLAAPEVVEALERLEDWRAALSEYRRDNSRATQARLDIARYMLEKAAYGLGGTHVTE